MVRRDGVSAFETDIVIQSAKGISGRRDRRRLQCCFRWQRAVHLARRRSLCRPLLARRRPGRQFACNNPSATNWLKRAPQPISIHDRAAVGAERGAANSGSGSSSASTRARQVSSAYLYQVSSPRPMT